MLLPITTTCPLIADNGKIAVSRAVEYDPDHHNPIGMLCSRKLNGVRCVVHLTRGQRPRYFTRNGHEITGLDQLDEPLIQRMNHPVEWSTEIVLDGELALAAEDGSDDFAGLVSAIQRKDYIVPQPRLHVIDLLTADEFRAGRSRSTFAGRQAVLRQFVGDDCNNNQPLVHVEQTPIHSLPELTARVIDAASRGWEGLVLRSPHSSYRSGPDESVLKVKRWTDCEARVIGVRYQNGQMSSVEVVVAGQKLVVSDGFSAQQRTEYAAAPSRLFGADVTISFTHGLLSCPRVLHVYEGGRPD